MELGRIGVWRAKRHGASDLAQLEALGYGTFWIGASPSRRRGAPVPRGDERPSPIATGILNVWQHTPQDVAAAQKQLVADFPDRFLLGIGIGHPEATSDYTRPLKTMREFFDGMDLPKEQLIAAALGPKMLDLAAERSLGTHPYFITPEHTKFARERARRGRPRRPRGRGRGRNAIPRRPARPLASTPSSTSACTNYTTNLLKFGFTEQDIANGGSDRLIDAVIPHGSAEQIADAIHAHFEAGADHVCLQPLGHGPHPARDYEELAKALL